MMPTLGLEGILATYRETKFISVYVVLTRLAMLLCICLPIVVFNLGVQAALIGFVASSFVSFVVALYLKYYPVRNYGRKATSETYKSIFKFCFPLFLASIWGILINSTDQFFISRYFGNEVFADFSNGAMELPFVGIILSATSTVLTPLFTRQINENCDLTTTIIPVWNHCLSKTVMLIYPITIFCLFNADSIMVAMYGDQYIASGDFFKIKLFTYFFKVIVFYSLIVALGATKFYQWVFFIYFILLVSTEMAVLKWFPDPLIITAIHVLFTFFCTIVMWIFIGNKLQIPLKSLIPANIILRVLITSLISCTIIKCINKVLYSHLPNLQSLIIDISIMIIIYWGLSHIFKLNYYNIIKPLLKR